MCGRYALHLRFAQVRQSLQEAYMPSQDEPEDDDVRQTYNFAPGYYGLVYRQDAPDAGNSTQQEPEQNSLEDGDLERTVPQDDNKKQKSSEQNEDHTSKPSYRLQAMKWGLIPFWTKRNPDYGSMMKTINCRDDSLATSGGMWHTMKQRKRCVIIAEGFYEWLKKNGGKEKIPHYVKRKDGQLMCFAGLWDCVKYEDAEKKLYTYSIITTDSNKQLNFLHDRMPVILNNGSKELFKWLDANQTVWTNELQALLKPFDGELECYPVSKDVGKVGNNSPQFVIPIDSVDNKNNIANFFGNQKALAKDQAAKKELEKTKDEATHDGSVKVDPEETRPTTDDNDNDNDGENNAPKPVGGVKRQLSEIDEKRAISPRKALKASPSKPATKGRSRNSTSNETRSKSPLKAEDGSKKITNFFGK